MELLSWSKVPRNRLVDIDKELPALVPALVNSCHYLVFRLPDGSEFEVIHYHAGGDVIKTLMCKKR